MYSNLFYHMYCIQEDKTLLKLRLKIISFQSPDPYPKVSLPSKLENILCDFMENVREESVENS
jgi:hypothetical protein